MNMAAQDELSKFLSDIWDYFTFSDRYGRNTDSLSGRNLPFGVPVGVIFVKKGELCEGTAVSCH